jgi:hypothetical protein
MNNRVISLEVHNNELYAAGHFQTAGGVPTRGIARWNGTNWNQVGGPGLNLSAGFVGTALKPYGNDLYLAGGFYLVNGLSVHSIARWKGTAWDSVGTIDELWSFRCLENYNNKLYAGGYMTINGNNSLHWISRWDGTNWDSLSQNINGVPNTMTIYNSELYVAGDFDSAGTIQSYGIARWDDVQWNNVSSGLDLYHLTEDTSFVPDTSIFPTEHIYTMCTYNNELYVGGIFSMIGGINANSIAKWHINGVSISELSSEVTPTLFPNPFTTHATIKFPSALHSATFRLYNLYGQLITETSGISGESFRINAEGFRSGVYVYEVTEKEKKICGGKAVVY